MTCLRLMLPDENSVDITFSKDGREIRPNLEQIEWLLRYVELMREAVESDAVLPVPQDPERSDGIKEGRADIVRSHLKDAIEERV